MRHSCPFGTRDHKKFGRGIGGADSFPIACVPVMGSLVKKRRKRMRKKKHRKMLKRTRAQRMRGK